jgi:hypothetical protein
LQSFIFISDSSNEHETTEMHHSSSVPKSAMSWQDSSLKDSVRSKAKVGEESTLTPSKHVSFHGKTEESDLHKMSKHKLDALRASTDKLFHSKRDENKRMKAVFGALAGLVIGGLLFVLLVESFGYTPLVAGIIVALSTVIICFGLAMWSTCRCVMALVLPNFFTGKGRAVFLSVTFGVMLAGPITNITLNAKETGSSMACVLDRIGKQTKTLQESVAQSAVKVADYINQQKVTLDRIKDSMVVDFDQITKGVQKMSEELHSANIQINKLYEASV